MTSWVAPFRIGEILWGKSVAAVGRFELELPSCALLYGEALALGVGSDPGPFVAAMGESSVVFEIALGASGNEPLAVLIRDSLLGNQECTMAESKHGFGVDSGIVGFVDPSLSDVYMRSIGEDSEAFLSWWASVNHSGFAVWSRPGVTALLVRADDGAFFAHRLLLDGRVRGLFIPLAADPYAFAWEHDRKALFEETFVLRR